MSPLAALQTGVLDRLVDVLVSLAAGVVAQLTGVLDGRWTARLNDLAFYVALPALVFAVAPATLSTTAGTRRPGRS